MRWQSLIVSWVIIALDVEAISAATLRLTVGGTISSVVERSQTEPAPAGVGDAWQATIQYHFPTTPTFADIGRVSFDTQGVVTTLIGGTQWLTEDFLAEATLMPGQTVRFTFMPSANGLNHSDPIGVFLELSNGSPFLFDLSSLPRDFNDWDLPAAENFSFNAAGGTIEGGWSVAATSYSKITIEPVPEPSIAALLFCAIVTSFLRRTKRTLQ
jgi:hypothetical protein